MMQVDGLFPDDVDLGALLLDDDDDMAKVLIDASTALRDDMVLIWAPPIARGGTMPFCLIFFRFSNRHLRRAAPKLVSDFVVIGDVPDGASSILL
jgi:hypothetical protein